MKATTRQFWCVALAMLAVGCGAAQDDATGAPLAEAQKMDTRPIGKGGGTALDHFIAPTGHASSANNIVFHGGPIMSGPVNIYFIWYGNWAGNTATSILTDWANSIGGSAYYNINNTYYDDSGNRVANAVRYAGSTSDNYSRGTQLSDDNLGGIVLSAILSGRLPMDTNGVYFVLTSQDVTATSGYCTQYCGWHTWLNFNGKIIKYSFVGNADSLCPSVCEEQFTSPNDNPGADGMVSVMSHELEEAASDPQLNAWYDTSSPGQENADKCAWTFGPEYTTANGARANVHLGSRDYLIQQNWVNAFGGYCDLSYPYTTQTFHNLDSRLTTQTGDWRYNSYKSECGPTGAVTGLSREAKPDGHAHAALCRWDSASTYPHQSCHTVAFTSGDNRWTTSTGDWDPNHYKGECAVNEYVAGVSQASGKVDSILCCAGAVAHNACSARRLIVGDSREPASSDDWDYGYWKAECGNGRYAAGVGRLANEGLPTALLCCSP